MCSSSDVHIAGARKVMCTRTQVPLDLAWAITIHKPQGLTVGPEEGVRKVIVDFGQTEGWAPA